MPTSPLSIERDGRRWAIKHNGGFLGHVRSEADAWALIETLSSAAVSSDLQALSPDPVGEIGETRWDGPAVIPADAPLMAAA